MCDSNDFPDSRPLTDEEIEAARQRGRANLERGAFHGPLRKPTLREELNKWLEEDYGFNPEDFE